VGAIGFPSRSVFIIVTCFLCAAVFPHAASASGDVDVAELLSRQSTVLVQGSEFGTGFAFLNHGDSTYFLTVAHLLNKDVYVADARLPADQRKPAAAWFAIYDPVDGLPHSAEIVGRPDFLTDTVVLRARSDEFSHPFRALCLAQATPSISINFDIASFSLLTITGQTVGQPFTSQQRVIHATDTITPLVGTAKLEYTAPAELGYSGSPLIDVQSGVVVGTVKESPYDINPETSQQELSTVTRDAVSIDAINAFIKSLAPLDPALGDVPQLNIELRSELLPSLHDGSDLKLLVFDNPGSAALNAPDGIFRQWYQQKVTSIIKNRFAFRDYTGGVITRAGALSPSYLPMSTSASGTPPIDIRDILNGSSPCDLRDPPAAGALGVLFSYAKAPGLGSVSSGVYLISCTGHIVDSRTFTVPMTYPQPSSDQIDQYLHAFDTALATLGGLHGERLVNFMMDGLPLANGEKRGFYSVRPGATVGYAWADGMSADVSHLYVDRTVSVIDTLSIEEVQVLTSDQLDRVINRAGGRLAVTYEPVNQSNLPPPLSPASPDPNDAVPMLATADRCTYFLRLAQKAADTQSSPPLRKETIP
jgi:hypothetical protein